MNKRTLKKLIKGDQKVFKEFYDEYVESAYRTAMGITRDREIAKDAVQETFVRVYKYIANYDVNKPFEPWFYQILKNECLRLLKKESKVRNLFEYNEELLIEDVFEENKHMDTLIEAVQSLKESYRIPIILKYIKGFTEKEISEILDINQNTVKSRLFHARGKLKLIFENLNKEGIL